MWLWAMHGSCQGLDTVMLKHTTVIRFNVIKLNTRLTREAASARNTISVIELEKHIKERVIKMCDLKYVISIQKQRNRD